MSRIKQLAGQTIIYGGGHILSKVVYYLLVVVLLTHLLNDENLEFGTFSSFYAYSAVLIILFSFRLDTALFRFGTNSEDRQSAYNTSFTTVILLSVILISIGLFAYEYIAPWTVAPDRPIYVRWFAFILAFDIISLIPYAKLRLDNEARKFALFKILNVLISSILILFFLIILPRLPQGLKNWFPSYEHIIDYVFIANLIASFSILVLLFLKVGSVSFKINISLLKKMFFYISPLVIVGVANSFIQFYAVPLQEEFLGNSDDKNLFDAGTYEASRRIAGLFAMFITAFNFAAEPFFFKNASESDRHLYYGKICHFFSLVGGLVIITMVFSLDIIQYIIGKSFRESIFVIPILLLGYLFLGLYYNVSIWYKLSDNTKYGAMVSICGLIIFFFINIVFLKQFGYVVTAWATVATYGSMVIIAYVLGQKIYPIPYPIKKILANIIIIVAIVTASNYVKQLCPMFIYYTVGVVTLCLYMLYAYKVEEGEWNTMLNIKKT
ncbi:oligosaccharide flippase family protein [Saprospiraceae bacterium]|nr:oligosaccharide flippase family protein [Saprospiraceae bacterium]